MLLLSCCTAADSAPALRRGSLLLQHSADLDQRVPNSWLEESVSLSLKPSCMFQYVVAVCWNGELMCPSHPASDFGLT